MPAPEGAGLVGRPSASVPPPAQATAQNPPSVQQQNPDGSWSPAAPIGWQEEHGRLARFLFWLRRIEHCNDREGQRRPWRVPDPPPYWLITTLVVINLAQALWLCHWNESCAWLGALLMTRTASYYEGAYDRLVTKTEDRAAS